MSGAAVAISQTEQRKEQYRQQGLEGSVNTLLELGVVSLSNLSNDALNEIVSSLNGVRFNLKEFPQYVKDQIKSSAREYITQQWTEICDGKGDGYEKLLQDLIKAAKHLDYERLSLQILGEAGSVNELRNLHKDIAEYRSVGIFGKFLKIASQMPWSSQKEEKAFNKTFSASNSLALERIKTLVLGTASNPLELSNTKKLKVAESFLTPLVPNKIGEPIAEIPEIVCDPIVKHLFLESILPDQIFAENVKRVLFQRLCSVNENLEQIITREDSPLKPIATLFELLDGETMTLDSIKGILSKVLKDPSKNWDRAEIQGLIDLQKERENAPKSESTVQLKPIPSRREICREADVIEKIRENLIANNVKVGKLTNKAIKNAAHVVFSQSFFTVEEATHKFLDLLQGNASNIEMSLSSFKYLLQKEELRRK